MSTVIQAIANEQLKQNIPDFSSGDTLVVWVKVKEGNRERLQAFEGVCIAIKNRGINSAFIVRKISHGEGVERTFQTHSPLIDRIEVKRHGKVRQAKLGYLRDLTGRAARIKEDISKSNKMRKLAKELGAAAPAEAAAPAATDAADSKED